MTQASKAKSLIEAMKPGWTVSLGTDAPGRVEVSTYKAVEEYGGSGQVTRAGARLDFDYISSDPSLSNYRFVQVVYTPHPQPGAPSDGYLDPWVNDDPAPYLELP